jgi:hypothetical protein
MAESRTDESPSRTESRLSREEMEAAALEGRQVGGEIDT